MAFIFFGGFGLDLDLKLISISRKKIIELNFASILMVSTLNSSFLICLWSFKHLILIFLVFEDSLRPVFAFIKMIFFTTFFYKSKSRLQLSNYT